MQGHSQQTALAQSVIRAGNMALVKIQIQENSDASDFSEILTQQLLDIN